MASIRERAEEDTGVEDAILESVKPVKDLLNEIFQRLSLKDKHLKTFESASRSSIDEMFTDIREKINEE